MFPYPTLAELKSDKHKVKRAWHWDEKPSCFTSAPVPACRPTRTPITSHSMRMVRI